MATLESRIVSLAQAIGADIKTLLANQGNLASLTTTHTASLVAAINELDSAIGAIDLTDLIDDAALGTATDVAYSPNKITSLLSSLKSEILGGIPSASLDTIKELADFLSDNTITGGIVEQLGNRVRVDAAQSFNSGQQSQGRSNIGAAAAADLSALTTAIGNTDRDFAGDYATAKA